MHITSYVNAHAERFCGLTPSISVSSKDILMGQVALTFQQMELNYGQVGFRKFRMIYESC